jgi:hypothetical protein
MFLPGGVDPKPTTHAHTHTHCNFPLPCPLSPGRGGGEECIWLNGQQFSSLPLCSSPLSPQPSLKKYHTYNNINAVNNVLQDPHSKLATCHISTNYIRVKWTLLPLYDWLQNNISNAREPWYKPLQNMKVKASHSGSQMPKSYAESTSTRLPHFGASLENWAGWAMAALTNI